MSRPAWCACVAGALMGVAALLIAADSGVRDTALRAPLEGIPSALGGWSVGPPPAAPVVAADANAAQHLLRSYQAREGAVWVAVDYYPRQVEGRRPAAREMLFPGRGVTELHEERVSIPLGDGAKRLEANLVVIRAGNSRMAVLYWYQIGARSVADDHWYRAALVYRRLALRRADGALVRVYTAVGDEEAPATVVATRQSEFIRVFYPRLLRALPA